MGTSSTVLAICDCDVMVMQPKRLDEPTERYEHVCERCNGGISDEHYQAFDRYYGFSGYDE
jgi:predicted SprT family Zn-dependent metalloprotease